MARDKKTHLFSKTISQHNKKRYVYPHIYSMKYKIWFAAYRFRHEPLPGYSPYNQYPQDGIPNLYLKGRELYDALIRAGILVEWEEVDGLSRSMRKLADSDDEEEEDETRYPGAVKFTPGQKKERAESRGQKAAKKARLGKVAIRDHGDEQTVDSVENGDDAEEGAEGTGEGMVVERSASAVFPGEIIVARPLPSSQEARIAKPPSATQTGTPAEGFFRNLEREKSGKKKRGRPLGVKNKPKQTPESVGQDYAKL